MTTFAAAQENLYDEVKMRVSAIVPNKYEEVKLGFIGLEERSNAEFPGHARRARLCDLDLDSPLTTRWDYVGAGTVGITVEYPLRISYPRAPGWQDAMIDDVLRIQTELWANPSTTAGVQLRTISEIKQPIKSQEDSWTVAQLVLRVVYDITPT